MSSRTGRRFFRIARAAARVPGAAAILVIAAVAAAGLDPWSAAAAQVAEPPAPPLEHTYFELTLTGDAVPGGGSRNGIATGTLSIDGRIYRVVWGFRFSGIDPPTALHLHRGGAGETGPGVLSLGPGTLIGGSATSLSGSLDAPLDVDRGLRREILASPQDFYLQIVTRSAPDGAVRAQLASPGD